MQAAETGSQNREILRVAGVRAAQLALRAAHAANLLPQKPVSILRSLLPRTRAINRWAVSRVAVLRRIELWAVPARRLVGRARLAGPLSRIRISTIRCRRSTG